MEFRPQPWWKPWFRRIVLFVVVAAVFITTIYGLALQLPLFALSPYGLVVGIRTLFQIGFSSANNRWVQYRQRSVILRGVEQLTGRKIGRLARVWLINMPDFRHFREEVVAAYGVEWQQVVTTVFANLGWKIEELPPVMVEVPVYRPESIEEVAATVNSILNQSYSRVIEVLVGFNDPTNTDMQGQVEKFVRAHGDPRLKWVNLERASKRHAMYAGFQEHIARWERAIEAWLGRIPTIGEVNGIIKRVLALTPLERAKIHPDLNLMTCNIDGDTQLDGDAIFLGVLQLLLDPKTNAVTSNVEIRNVYENFLTRVTYVRYKYANLIERGAQSFFKTVRCMSGPYMLFWTHSLLAVDPRGEFIVDAWVNERFLGVPVGPGDDRSLTVRYNEVGLGVSFNPDIYNTTDCPTSWKRWVAQQLRWMRSANRNFIISLKFISQLPTYVVFDDLYLFFFPMLLMLIVFGITVQAIDIATTRSLESALQHVLPYLLVIAGINLAKSIHLALSQKNPIFLLMSTYFVLHLRWLVWLRLWSFPTINDSAWLGRSAADFKADKKKNEEAEKKKKNGSTLLLL